MNSEEKAYRGCGTTLLLLVALLLVANVVLIKQCTTQPEPKIIIERDTVYCDTTIINPVPAEVKPTERVIYIKIPVDTARPSTGSGTASVGVGPSTCSGTANEWTARPSTGSGTASVGSTGDYTIALPVVQKVYRDSMYTAWVSGYEPALDSISLRLPTITERITETIVKPAPRLTVGLQVGAGVGMFQHRPDVYVGIGASYRLWPK